MSAEQKHTTGPWHWNHGTLIADKTGTRLLYVTEAPGLGSQADDILCLISAAPELLEALQVMVDMYDPYPSPEHNRKARAAIAKATGGSDV